MMMPTPALRLSGARCCFRHDQAQLTGREYVGVVVCYILGYLMPREGSALAPCRPYAGVVFPPRHVVKVGRFERAERYGAVVEQFSVHFMGHVAGLMIELSERGYKPPAAAVC